MDISKQSYLSPATGVLEITVVRDARPYIAITLDLGIPNFTVFSLKLPLAQDKPSSMSTVVAEAVHVLLDEVSAFMLSTGFAEEIIVQIYATVLATYKSMSSETDSNKSVSPASKDPTIKSFEGTFKLPMAFVNETYEHVVTAGKVINVGPKRRHLELTYEKPSRPTVDDASKVIRQYRNRSLKSQPNPLYIIVYDQMGKPKATIPLGTDFKNKLLNVVYKKGSQDVEFSSTVRFNNEMEVKTTNVNGIPQSIVVEEQEFKPEAHLGTDMALYRGGDWWLVKFPDGRVVPFESKPSVERLRATNYPVPGDYPTRWIVIQEEEKTKDNKSVDAEGNEVNKADAEAQKDNVDPVPTNAIEPTKHTGATKVAKDAMRCSECGAEFGKNENTLETCPECGAEVYWSGTNDGASGVLPICPATRRVCLAWRSAEVHGGDCWGTIGGAIKGGNAAQSAKTEMAEEVGYTGAVEMHPAYVFTDGDFRYYNFLGVVPQEFEFNPHEDHAWETDTIEWFALEEIQEMLRLDSSAFHHGLIALFKNSGDDIRKLLGEVSTKPVEE